MKRTYAYFISLMLLLSGSTAKLHAQDTLDYPLKFRMGFEVSGPAIYFADKKNMNAEGYFSIDLNEKRSFVFSAGYSDFQFSQYNYNYLNKGAFVRTGLDFNLMKPEKSQGKYWAGIGLRYGISRFTSEVPFFSEENYWGTTSSAIARKTSWGHFIEASPGVRAEIFNHFSIGWTLSLRMLLYTGTGKDLRPIYFPGFGNGAKTFSTGISYFIVWNVPYKRIRVITKKEAPPEPEDDAEPGNAGTIQQGTIRQ